MSTESELSILRSRIERLESDVAGLVGMNTLVPVHPDFRGESGLLLPAEKNGQAGVVLGPVWRCVIDKEWEKVEMDASTLYSGTGYIWMKYTYTTTATAGFWDVGFSEELPEQTVAYRICPIAWIGEGGPIYIERAPVVLDLGDC